MAKVAKPTEVVEAERPETLLSYEENNEPVQYELTYLLVPTVNDVEQSSVSEHIRKIVEKLEGKIADESVWGKQKLSYAIQGHTMGVYVVLKLSLPTSSVTKLERELRLLEPVMRHLIIRKDSEKVKRMKMERAASRKKKQEVVESTGISTDPDLEILTPEKAEKIKEEMRKDLAEKKVTSAEKLEEIDKKLDAILEDDLKDDKPENM